jgi:hypothetical protein
MQRVTGIRDTYAGIIVSLDDQTQIRVRKPLRASGNSMEVDSPSHRLTFTQTNRADIEDMNMTVFDKRTQTQDVVMIRPMHWSEIMTAAGLSAERGEAIGKVLTATMRKKDKKVQESPLPRELVGYTAEFLRRGPAGPQPEPEEVEYSGGRKRRKTSRLPSKSSRRQRSRRSRKSRGGARSL